MKTIYPTCSTFMPYLGSRRASATWSGCSLALSVLAGAFLTRGTAGLHAADLKSGSRTEAFTNYVQRMPGSTISFEMAAIPGETITLGTAPEKSTRNTNDLPQRKVMIQPFWIGRFEVSWQEYLPFVFFDLKTIVRNVNKLEGCLDRDGISHPTKPYGSVYRDRGEKGYPAMGMGLPAAYEYCRWLSKKTGLHYRLPTEDEWEYACRAGAATAYFWGDDPARAREYGWFEQNSDDSTHPLGKLKPNPFGLYDIVGNVAEWCFDPVKPPTFVVRGGAFSNAVSFLRCADRLHETPEWNELDPQYPQSIWWLASTDSIGFRVARSFEEDSSGERQEKESLANAMLNYRQFCAYCHGLDGRGNTGVGKRLRARDYTDARTQQNLDDKAMFTAIKRGRIHEGFTVMSPFSTALTDAEIEALVAYMKSFKH